MLGMSLGLRPLLSVMQVGDVAPTNIALPMISGVATQGQTLTATTGNWTGTSPIAYSYVWEREGVAIPGATASSYTLQAADVGTALRVVVRATNSAGTATANSAATAAVSGTGQTLAALPVPPYTRWHPAFSNVSTSGGRVVSASDLQGLAAVSEGAAGIGPRVLTDPAGRKFWRFEEAEFLNIAAAMTLNNRNASVFFVGRVHRSAGVKPIFSGGNVAQGSQLSGGAILDVSVASNSAPFLRCVSRAGSLDATNARWMVAGSQLQVMGTCSRTTAAGGISLFINERKASTPQSTISRPVLTGGEIGRNPIATSQFGGFDLYELIVYDSALSDTDAAATQAALMSNYAVVPVEHQIVLEGDSITQGTGNVTSGYSCGVVLSEPLSGLIPANWRVLNMGASGNQITDLITKRDAVSGWPSMIITGGQNLLAYEIGRNDFAAGGNTSGQHYTNVVAYLNTAATGILQQGWTVRAIANIATSPAIQIAVDEFRALMRNTNFLLDTLTGPGQTYAGKLSIISTDLIQYGGETIFFDSNDAADTNYYAGDSTHPNILGAQIRVTGGQTPHYGLGYGL